MSSIEHRIAQELNVGVAQVTAAVTLLDEGATVPFISRYRKEVTGGLDDSQLRTLEDRLRYLRELEDRRVTILASIDEQGKLTGELAKAIESADTKTELEDLYLPYKPKRRTKGQIAIEAGLEPLADALLADPTLDPEQQAEAYLNPDQGVADTKAALDGARAILMERFAEDAGLIGKLREYLWQHGEMQARMVDGKEQEGAKFRDYFEHNEPIKKVPSHRALAMFRGRNEGVLQLSLVLPGEEPRGGSQGEVLVAEHFGLEDRSRAADRWLSEVVRWTWRVKLLTHIETDLFNRVREAAEQAAIDVFAKNLKDLLLAAPAGPKATIGLDLFLNDTPLMDVRAPIEFRQGAFPNATNIPLLDNDQREAIGIRYKEAGQASAIELGLELATPEIRKQRLHDWSDFARAHPDGYLYCFRGGLRSNTTQTWLREAGIGYPLIRGGYKALRRLLLDSLHRCIDRQPIQVLAGPTGSGKTELIHDWPTSLDLEGRANHRGSAFGRTFTEQPSQIDWENRIAIDWAKLDREPHGPVLVEDESRLIGRINLPPELQERMLAAPLIVLEADMGERIERLKTDYVRHALAHFQTTEPDAPFEALQAYIANNLHRIRKRLGGLKHQQLQAVLPQAVRALERQADWTGFEQLIESLLTDYYDPMYRYQLEKRSHQVIFQGPHDAILDWLARQAA